MNIYDAPEEVRPAMHLQECRRNDDGSRRRGADHRIRDTRIILAWIFPALAILSPLSLPAAPVDPSLVPSIFTPESTPAYATNQLSHFVLETTAGLLDEGRAEIRHNEIPNE